MSITAKPAAVAHRRPAAGKYRGARGRTARWRLLWNTVSVIASLAWIFPVYWMIITAFKPTAELNTWPPTFFPHHPSLSGFKIALNDGGFWTAVENTVIVAGVTMVLAILIGFMAALAIARFNFFGRRAFLFSVMIVQMVPLIAVLLPLYLQLSDLHMLDKLSGLIVAYLVFSLPFTVWTLRGFVYNIPKDLEEAAMVDGCSRFRAFYTIILPLAMPGLVATSIYTLVLCTNEVQMTTLIVQNNKHDTISLWLESFTTSQGTQLGPVMAGATMLAIPIMILFLLVQKHMAAGMTAGAVKG